MGHLTALSAAELPAVAAGAECAWLRSPMLPRTFVLELLDFVLGANAATFRASPVFEHALLARVCHLLLAQLHDLLDPTIEGHSQVRPPTAFRCCGPSVIVDK